MRQFFLVLALSLFSLSLFGQYSITTLNSNLTVENFNSFDGSGFAPSPTAGQLDSDIWSVTGLSDGDLAFGATGDSGDFARGTSTGGVGTGGIYAFEVGTGDFALGIQSGGSDFTPGDFILQLQNNTGVEIVNLTVSYDIEIFNNENRSSSFNFSHSATNSSFIDVASLNFTSTADEDGSPAWATNARNTTLTGLSIANGADYFLRWTGDDVGGSGSRDEFALNNVVINASAIPEPSTYALIFGGLALGFVIWRRRKS